MSRNVSYRGEKRPDVSEKFYTEGERGPGPVGNILPSKETLKRIHIKCGDVSLPGRRLEGPPPPPQDFFISREAGKPTVTPDEELSRKQSNIFVEIYILKKTSIQTSAPHHQQQYSTKSRHTASGSSLFFMRLKL
ncbi:hypothetical protein FOCC_FOCC004463 [Frankliniella occidentalis]|nr:hypothetical protein FOCC_FOCC004463 [Frankliniella occidentalis]